LLEGYRKPRKKGRGERFQRWGKGTNLFVPPGIVLLSAKERGEFSGGEGPREKRKRRTVQWEYEKKLRVALGLAGAEKRPSGDRTQKKGRNSRAGSGKRDYSDKGGSSEEENKRVEDQGIAQKPQDIFSNKTERKTGAESDGGNPNRDRLRRGREKKIPAKTNVIAFKAEGGGTRYW